MHIVLYSHFPLYSSWKFCLGWYQKVPILKYFHIFDNLFCPTKQNQCFFCQNVAVIFSQKCISHDFYGCNFTCVHIYICIVAKQSHINSLSITVYAIICAYLYFHGFKCHCQFQEVLNLQLLASKIVKCIINVLISTHLQVKSSLQTHIN